MKKPALLNLLIGFTLLLSGCSNGYSSNAQHQKVVNQQQAAVHLKKIQQARAQHAQRQQTNLRPRLIPAPVRAPARTPVKVSQQTRSNAIMNQQHARDLISRMAHSTIGAPYKWGGNNPHQGFDCSGLMSYVHKNALGINIPRTAAAQRDQSRTVAYKDLKPGDMLFFKTGRNANHVGVYIGNRKFVHAATGSKEVKVASMDSPYWHKRFVKFGTFL